MGIITFDETKHQYFNNEKRVPSVSELLSLMLDNQYVNVSSQTMEIAREYGNAVHKEISDYIELKSENYHTKEARNVIQFIFPRYEITPLKSERIVSYEINGEMCFCGTIDLLYLRKGVFGIGDFKTTSTLYIDHIEAQLNLYLLAVEQTFNMEVQELSVFHLKGDTRKVKPIKINRPKYEKFLKVALEKWREKENDKTR